MFEIPLGKTGRMENMKAWGKTYLVNLLNIDMNYVISKFTSKSPKQI
jgi:hypothetical protein